MPAHYTEWRNWRGEKNRPLQVRAPCPCGCSPFWYLTASDGGGNGFTVRLPDEDSARAIAHLMRVPVHDYMLHDTFSGEGERNHG